MKILEVDGQTVDLYPTTVIAQTMQVFDPGRLGSIVTNYTASVKAPRTRNNEITFGFLTSKTKSDIPYSSLSCRYFENGLPIIRNARIVINEVNEQEYSFTIYSGPWGFFERILDKFLWDLDFSDLNGPWTEVTRDGYRNTTTGILQALIDDGLLESLSPPVINYQESRIRCPQIYYHTIVEKIFSTFGFTVVGDIFTNDIYKKLAMPLSVAYLDPRFLNSKVFQAAADGTQVIINPVSSVNVEFTENVKQGSDNFYDGVSEYVVVNADTPNGYFSISFRTDVTIEVTGGTVDLKIEATGLSPSGLAVQLNKGTGTYTLILQGSTAGFADGDIIKVTVVNNSGSPTVEVINAVFYSYPLTGIEDENDESYLPTIVEDYVYFQKLFEEVKLIDFLKEFCVRFNCQITQINNVLHVNTLNHILDIRTGPDWTAKRHKGPEKIKYLFSSYGRTNELKTPIDTEFTPNLTSVYGDAEFEIPNENLRERLTIYTSIMKATQMITTFGVFMLDLNIRRVNEISTLPETIRYPGNRLFFVRDKYDFEPEVVYDSINRDDYKVGYFFDPTQLYELSWQLFIDNFHQKFIDRCLRKVRLIERVYNLSDLDIYGFNQQEPIWDNGERFLVTKIINRVSKKLCKVELLKIESNPEHFFVQGTANNISGALEDLLEIIGNDLVPELDIQFSLVENVTGNPTWECTFTSTEDNDILTAIGNGASDSGILDHHGMLDVDADVLKTDNDGFGTPTFPTATGYVEWLRNGVRVNTAVFDGSGPSSSFGLNFTYLNVKAWEVLLVKVFEDGSTP